jgi:hypothetical protein
MQQDVLPLFARSDLDRLRLAADILLRLAEDGAIPETLEAELVIFRDRVEHALLLPPDATAAAPAAHGTA